MLTKNDIVKRERALLEKFFQSEFRAIPALPLWVTTHLIQHWQNNLFHLHYLPHITLSENYQLPLWHDRPSKYFYRKIRAAELDQTAASLGGRWILIDGRDKPPKKVPWIRVNDVWLLQQMGFNIKKYLKRWNRQRHHREYLLTTLRENGFGSRFCLTRHEIDALKPVILKFLKINLPLTIRLPYLIEYNYLGNAIYTQWRTTQTWEWFEDKLNTGQYLAGGSFNVGCMGWEPPEFWSTILTFRPVIEL